MRIQQGFTLIELIVVIVILGILAATALPKFIDLKGDAAGAAIEGAAGALASAASLNYGGYMISSTKPGVVRVTASNACSVLAAGMASWDSAKFSISGEASCVASAAGTAAACTLRSQADTTKTATATIICTG